MAFILALFLYSLKSRSLLYLPVSWAQFRNWNWFTMLPGEFLNRCYCDSSQDSYLTNKKPKEEEIFRIRLLIFIAFFWGGGYRNLKDEYSDCTFITDILWVSHGKNKTKQASSGEWHLDEESIILHHWKSFLKIMLIFLFSAHSKCKEFFYKIAAFFFSIFSCISFTNFL